MALHDYGPVTAYAWAVENGHFTGTLAEWVEMIGNVSDNAAAAVSAKSDAITAKNAAISARTAAQTASSDAEAWAKGTRGGTAVDSSDEAYHANAAYHAGQAAISAALAAASELVCTAEAGAGHAPAIRVTAPGPVAHFTDGAAAPMVLDIAIRPNQAGSGDPSPSNVREISGWTGVNVVRTGKNVISFDSISLGKPGNRTAQMYLDTPIPPGLYKISYVRSGTFNGNFGLNLYDSTTVGNNVGEINVSTGEIEITGVARRVYLYIPTTAYNNDETLTLENIQLELGSAATDYEPHSSQSYSIALPAGAGTVYGGNLHINQDGSGVLTVDTAIITIGSKTWGYYSGANNTVRFSTTVSDLKEYASARRTPFVCSAFTCIDDGTSIVNTGDNITDNVIYGGSGTNKDRIFIICRSYTDATAFTNAFANETIVYPLANPSTYTFTAAQISSLFGENNVWAETGSVTVEYTADTKLFIERLTQPDQDWIADAGIENGAYFMVGNDLYRATTAIAAGEAIAPGTNCTKKSLAAALNEINA